MASIVINPFLQFGGGGGGGSSVPIAIVGRQTAQATTGTVFPTVAFKDSSEVATSELTNDVVIAMLQTSSGDTANTPSGYAAITGSPLSTSVTKNWNYWFRPATDDIPSWVITDVGDHCITTGLQLRNVKTSGNPWNVIGSGTLAAGTSLTIPGVTTTVVNCVILVIVTSAAGGSSTFSGWTCATLTSFAEPFTSGCDVGYTGGGDDGSIAFATGFKATAGATGNITVTQSSSKAITYMVVALEPASP